MNKSPSDHAVASRLRDLLATERAAVLTGDYAKLEGISRRKSDLVAGIAASQPDADIAKMVRDALADSAAILKAARDGFRSGIENVTGAAPVTTALYQADGSRRVVQDTARRVERKA